MGILFQLVKAGIGCEVSVSAALGCGVSVIFGGLVSSKETKLGIV